MESINQTIIEAEVIEALRTIFDPEIPVNVYELGLIYLVEGQRRRGGGDSHDADLAALSGGAVDAGGNRSKGADDFGRQRCLHRSGLGSALGSK